MIFFPALGRDERPYSDDGKFGGGIDGSKLILNMPVYMGEEPCIRWWRVREIIPGDGFDFDSIDLNKESNTVEALMPIFSGLMTMLAFMNDYDFIKA